MASTLAVSVLVAFALIVSHILETNGNIRNNSNGLCNFGCEVKVAAVKSRFSRDEIFNGFFKVVHLRLQRMEVSSPNILSLQDAWNILRPFWVKEQYSDALLRTLRSVNFQKYSFKSSKTVFSRNVRLLETHINGCNVTATPIECVIRAVSYPLLRNITGGIGFICHDVLVKGKLQHLCCDLTPENSVQCKRAAIGSHVWLDVLWAAAFALFAVILCVATFLLSPDLLVILFLPYTADNDLTSSDDNTMVEPDQDVNPVTKHIKRYFSVGKLDRNSSSKEYGHAAIILTLATFVFIGILYAFIFSEMFSFEKENGRYSYILEALPAQTKSNFQNFLEWLRRPIHFLAASQFDRTPFKIFCLVWFHFSVLLLPPLLYIIITGFSIRTGAAFRFFLPEEQKGLEFLVAREFSKVVKLEASTVNTKSEASELLKRYSDIFVNIFCFVVRKTKMLNSSQVSPIYLLEVFVRSVVCILSFTALLVFCAFVYCGATVLVMYLPYLIFMVLISVASFAVITKIRVTYRRVTFVQIAGCLLFLILYDASIFGMFYTCTFGSYALTTTFTYSLAGLNVNHSLMLPYMTFYCVVVYFTYTVYSSYVSGYVELRELAFAACMKIVEQNDDDHRIRQVVSRDDKGVIRISEKLLKHIYNEMNPLKNTVREILLKMVVLGGLFYLFYQFIIEDEGTWTETRIPPLMQVVLTLSVGIFPKLYDACKTGPADKKNLTHMKKKSRVEKIVTTYIMTHVKDGCQEVIWV